MVSRSVLISQTTLNLSNLIEIGINIYYAEKVNNKNIFHNRSNYARFISKIYIAVAFY